MIILVKAGAPVDQTIEGLLAAGMEEGDIVVDGGNEWCVFFYIRCCGGAPPGVGAPESRRARRFCFFCLLFIIYSSTLNIFNSFSPSAHLSPRRYENTERRQAALAAKGLIEIGMGVSGGEEGARRGPAMMPGGNAEAYKFLQPIVEKVAAQTDDGPCVTYVGPGGASGGWVVGG